MTIFVVHSSASKKGGPFSAGPRYSQREEASPVPYRSWEPVPLVSGLVHLRGDDDLPVSIDGALTAMTIGKRAVDSFMIRAPGRV